MKKALLFTILFASFISFEAMSQCGRVSLIGEFNDWAGDHFMTRNPENPALFSTFLTVTAEDDITDPPDGIITMKFRANADWGVNWGATDFPSGTGTQGGPDIPVPPGNYYVTFDCSTGVYNFTTTCGTIGMIGEFNGWAADYPMYRDPDNLSLWTTTITLKPEDDTNDPPDGIIGLKFRENGGWTVNWGAPDFPSGTGVQDGANIPAVPGKYKVTFNCTTGEYNFVTTCGEIGIIGEFNGWAGDVWMTRSETNPDEWHAILTLTDAQDVDPAGDGFIKVKFRENADWAVNWGSTDFPSGIGTQNGPDLFVPLDDQGITTDYYVTFNCATGAYNFAATSGSISLIGEFNGWNGDAPMNRDAADPNLWTVSRSWYANSQVKFRENNDWTWSWGNTGWPSGIGITDNGPNIPLVAGKYDVTFNSGTGAYNFVENNTICGEIGLIGDFNEWGGSAIPYTDLLMVRDPEYPSQFTATVNFTSSTGVLFRMDADQSYTEVWGGTSLCQTGVKDPAMIISVAGGKYNITFNQKSGDYCFERLGNSVIAPKVFTMTMDGVLDEADWKIDQNISRVIDGTVTADKNTVNFGVTYNDEFLFVGINIIDAIPAANDGGEVFLDGNKSGGAYDDKDVHLKFGIGGIEIIHGPEGIQCTLGFGLTTGGYAGEVSIPWAALGITPGTVMGFDIIVSDDDTNTGVDYKMAWNGSLEDYDNTSGFGDLVFGVLSCGCISVYNETIGDVILRNPIDEPTKYIGTYDFDANYNLVFRKDLQGTVTWAKDVFPEGTAELGGPEIPATSGRYRIHFDCLTGEYKFVASALPAEGIAYAAYTATAPVIDGDLGEYELTYGSENVVAGNGPNNNTVTWGAAWDQYSLYLGVKVVDAVVEGSGNPWDNDAIEYYIDGNNDKGSKVEPGFDTQLIQDFLSNSTVDTALWFKADGVQATPDQWDAKWKITSDGYNVELRLAWDIFSFAPGRGRTIGFSMGNNDSDNGVGRDYQTVWYGTGSNWSNPADLGDLQLAGGDYFYGFEEIFFN
ncbi:MAG: hypothetical protein KBB71_08765, partial [Lentimicrobiaceae bacterium]|nr:hypothetical protein [Lentimicrobiaceae bacterium]